MDTKHFKRIGVHLLAAIIVLVISIPFIYMLSSSFKTDVEISRHALRIIPINPTLDNFVQLFERIPFFRMVLNTILVSTLSCLGAIILCSLVAYGFSRFKFKGDKILFRLILLTMMVPVQVFLIPQFRMYQFLGLYNTYVPLIMPYISTGFSIFLIRQVMSGIPKDLFECATVDGCSELMIFSKIAMPLTSSGIGIVAILTFMNSWNDFMTPLIYLNKEVLYTLTIGLSNIVGFYTISYGLPMSGALLSSIPTILMLTIVGQKYFVNGLMTGSVKG